MSKVPNLPQMSRFDPITTETLRDSLAKEPEEHRSQLLKF